MKSTDSFDKIFKDVNKVLIVLAHPDDAEVVCGGTIPRLIANGKEIRLVVTTNGGKGSKDNLISEEELAEVRKNEQINSALSLGIKTDQIFNLNIADGEFEDSIENISKIVFHIRDFKPDIVITHNPDKSIIEFFERSTWVNHRDHRKTGQVTIDAVYPYSRDTNFFQDIPGSHTVTKLLVTDSYSEKTVSIEITNFLEQKRKALSFHVNGIGLENVDSYIEEDKMENGYFENFSFFEIY